MIVWSVRRKSLLSDYDVFTKCFLLTVAAA